MAFLSFRYMQAFLPDIVLPEGKPATYSDDQGCQRGGHTSLLRYSPKPLFGTLFDQIR